MSDAYRFGFLKGTIKETIGKLLSWQHYAAQPWMRDQIAQEVERLQEVLREMEKGEKVQ